MATKKHNAKMDAHQLEKMLFSLPQKVAAQLKKDIAFLKQAEKKMKQELIKLGQRVKKNMPRQQAVKLTKLSQALTKQLKTLASGIDAALHKQNKMVALKKHLAQFEKSWLHQAKSSPKKTKKRTKKVAAKTAPKRPDVYFPEIIDAPEETSSPTTFEIPETESSEV